MRSSGFSRVAALTAAVVVTSIALSACGSSDQSSSTTATRNAAGASSEVVSCPNKSSSRRYLAWVNTTGIPLKVTSATANCVAFSQTGNPTSINAGVIRPETEQQAQIGTLSASQRLEMVACSSQSPATTCVWDATRKVYTDDCTAWDLTVARGDADPGAALGTVVVNYCGLSKTDQTVQLREGSGETWGSSVKLRGVVEAKPVYVTAGRHELGSSSTTAATYDPLLTIATR